METPEKSDIPNLLTQWKVYKSSGFNTVPGLEANALLPHGSEEPNCWWATRAQLAEADFSLGAGQWKPRTSDKVNDDNPVELIAEVMADYQKMVAGLEKLKAELAE